MYMCWGCSGVATCCHHHQHWFHRCFCLLPLNAQRMMRWFEKKKTRAAWQLLSPIFDSKNSAHYNWTGQTNRVEKCEHIILYCLFSNVVGTRQKHHYSTMDNDYTKQLVHLDATTPLHELLSSNYIWSKGFFFSRWYEHGKYVAINV